MEMRLDEGFQETIENKVRNRETNWDDFFKRYEKRDQTLNTRKYNDDLEEEIVHEEDIDPNTICLIDSEDEVSYEEEEEEEEGSDIDIDDDELELMEASNCPEFQTTFKQICQKRIETVKRTYEERHEEKVVDETTKDGAKRRTTINSKSISKGDMHEVIDMPSHPISNATERIRKLRVDSDSDSHDNRLALVKHFDPSSSHQISSLMAENGYYYKVQTVTKTVVETQIIACPSNPVLNDDMETISNAESHGSNEMPHASDDIFSTPTVNSRRRHIKQTRTMSTSSSPIHTPTQTKSTPRIEYNQLTIASPKTPLKRTSQVKPMQINAKTLITKAAKVCDDAERFKHRNIHLETNETLILEIPTEKTPQRRPSECDDFLFAISKTPKAILAKKIDGP